MNADRLEQTMSARDLELASIENAIQALEEGRVKITLRRASIDQIDALCDGIASSRVLNELTFEECDLRQLPTSRLWRALALCKGLRTLRMEECALNDLCGDAIAVVLRENRNLLRLYLAENRLLDAGVQRIANVLLEDNNTLRELDVRGNKVTRAGAESLADALAFNFTLTKVLVDDKKIYYRAVLLRGVIESEGPLTKKRRDAVLLSQDMMLDKIKALIGIWNNQRINGEVLSPLPDKQAFDAASSAGEIRMLMTQSREDAVEYVPRIKMMVVGGFECGKTSFVQCLTNRSAEANNEEGRNEEGTWRGTVFVDLRKWFYRTRRLVSIWDLSGHPTFFPFHPLCFSKNGLVCVVFDFEKYVKAPNAVARENFVEQQIMKWINTAQMHAPGSKIMLVGTHLGLRNTRKYKDTVKEARAVLWKDVNTQLEFMREDYEEFIETSERDRNKSNFPTGQDLAQERFDQCSRLIRKVPELVGGGIFLVDNLVERPVSMVTPRDVLDGVSTRGIGDFDEIRLCIDQVFEEINFTMPKSVVSLMADIQAIRARKRRMPVISFELLDHLYVNHRGRVESETMKQNTQDEERGQRDLEETQLAIGKPRISVEFDAMLTRLHETGWILWYREDDALCNHLFLSPFTIFKFIKNLLQPDGMQQAFARLATQSVVPEDLIFRARFELRTFAVLDLRIIEYLPFWINIENKTKLSFALAMMEKLGVVVRLAPRHKLEREIKFLVPFHLQKIPTRSRGYLDREMRSSGLWLLRVDAFPRTSNRLAWRYSFPRHHPDGLLLDIVTRCSSMLGKIVQISEDMLYTYGGDKVRVVIGPSLGPKKNGFSIVSLHDDDADWALAWKPFVLVVQQVEYTLKTYYPGLIFKRETLSTETHLSKIVETCDPGDIHSVPPEDLVPLIRQTPVPGIHSSKESIKLRLNNIRSQLTNRKLSQGEIHKLSRDCIIILEKLLQDYCYAHRETIDVAAHLQNSQQVQGIALYFQSAMHELEQMYGPTVADNLRTIVQRRNYVSIAPSLNEMDHLAWLVNEIDEDIHSATWDTDENNFFTYKRANETPQIDQFESEYGNTEANNFLLAVNDFSNETATIETNSGPYSKDFIYFAMETITKIIDTYPFQ